MLFKSTIVLSVILATAYGKEQDYPFLKTTFPGGLSGGFFPQPRTVDEAVEAGWSLIEPGKFATISKAVQDCTPPVYAPPGDIEMLLVFDANGFVAGMLSVVPVDVANDDFYPFSTSQWYFRGSFSVNRVTVDAYLTEMLFVDPSTICEGRSQEDFESQGTINTLKLVKGVTEDNIELIDMPLTQKEADGNPFWYHHYCFAYMGEHYFNLDYSIDADLAVCGDNIPLQLVYNSGKLNGFVWQHVAPIPGNRWETVNNFALNNIVNNAPTCLYDLVNNPGVRTMHVYVRDYATLCLFN